MGVVPLRNTPQPHTLFFVCAKDGKESLETESARPDSSLWCIICSMTVLCGQTDHTRNAPFLLAHIHTYRPKAETVMLL